MRRTGTRHAARGTPDFERRLDHHLAGKGIGCLVQCRAKVRKVKSREITMHDGIDHTNFELGWRGPSA